MQFLCFVGSGERPHDVQTDHLFSGVFTRWSFVTDNYQEAAGHPKMRKVYRYDRKTDEMVLILRKEWLQ